MNINNYINISQTGDKKSKHTYVIPEFFNRESKAEKDSHLSAKKAGMKSMGMSARFIVGILMLVIIAISSGCEDTITTAVNKDLVVVQGFLYADEPVKDISLSEVLPLGSLDTIATPIVNAEVVVSNNNKQYLLIADNTRPGFYLYPDNDLVIKSGDELSLEINYNEQNITAKTSVPPKPQNVVLDSDTLLLPSITTNIREIPDLDYYSITLTWDNFDESYYYVVIQNVEENPLPIEILSGKFASKFVSAPSISSEYKASFRTVTHYGEHLMILYRVNEEYADLYESRDQDSRNLNEPLTNIENGLGIFSAFASDSVYFNVKKE